MEYIGNGDRPIGDEKKRSFTWATRWFSIRFDWGLMLRGGQDKFKQQELRRGWGLVFNSHPIGWLYFSTLYPAYASEREYWTDLRQNFEDNTSAIKAGIRKHPAMMTAGERHQATTELARRMKWSKKFVRAMTTPMAFRALKAGGTYTNEWDDELSLSPQEMKRLENGELEEFRLERKHDKILFELSAGEDGAEGGWNG